MLLFCCAGTAFSDWNEGEPYKMHYPQLPDPFGWDVAFLSVVPLELADDWECLETGSVSDIHFWVSWRGDVYDPIIGIQARIYSNNPVGLSGWSEPDQLLWSRDFQAGQFTERLYDVGLQGWYDPYTLEVITDDHWGYYQINITDISDPFIQQVGEIYWLGLEIVTAGGPVGWKTALPPNFMDDAVWRQPAGPWTELRDPLTLDSLDFAFVIMGEPSLANDDCENAEPVGDVTNLPFDTTTATFDGLGTCMSSPNIWYCYTATCTGAVTVSLCGSSYDTMLAVYDGCTCNPLGTELGCNDNYCGLQSEISFAATAGNEYLIEVGGWSTDTGEGLLSISIGCEPVYDKPLEPHTKWSQPPIEVDPNSAVPTYCGWDEDSNSRSIGAISVPVYQNWDAGGLGWYLAPPVYGFLPIMGDDMSLAGTARKLVSYSFAINSPIGTPSYIVTSELYTEVLDPCEGPVPGWPIAGTLCNHNVILDGYWWLTCSPGSGAILPDNLWMVLSFSDDYAGWQIAEQAELGSTDTTWALDAGDGNGFSLYWWGDGTHGGYEADILCEAGLSLLVADDFRCIGSMPVTSIRWWGSYIGWEGLEPPQLVEPIAWRIGFWSNVPEGVDANYSHPQELLWQIEVPVDRVYVDNVGQDSFPGMPSDTCFQYYLGLNEEEYFRQGDFNDLTQDNIFWLSITAVYPESGVIEYPWGWKTRPWPWMDDAVTLVIDVDAVPGATVDPCTNNITPIEYDGNSFDVSFELDTDPNYIKWEQLYTGIRHWLHYEDEKSMYDEQEPNDARLVFDDWQCLRRTPVTAIGWWGSYIGYGYEACSQGPSMPVRPNRFKLAMWTDVPAGSDPCYPFSHPNEVIWEYDAFEYDEVLVGYDKHPHGAPNEPVFRYSVRLPEEEWFHQPDYNGVFWLCVQAVYDVNTPNYDWGWTNHEHVFNDNAVAYYYDDVNEVWVWTELHDQTEASEDMSFMLFTDPDECSTCANYNCDARVNFLDYADFADDWRWVGPAGGYNNSDLDCNGVVDFKDLGIFCVQWLIYCPIYGP
jgi:hypothetical protein